MDSTRQYHIKLNSNMFRSRAEQREYSFFGLEIFIYYWSKRLLHNSLVKLYVNMFCCIYSMRSHSTPITNGVTKLGCGIMVELMFSLYF